MVGLTEVLWMRGRNGGFDYERSAIGFQTMKLSSADVIQGAPAHV
jgi:hypothetical protein